MTARLIDAGILALIGIAPIVVVLWVVIRRHTDVFSAAGGLRVALLVLDCVPLVAYVSYRVGCDGGGGRSVGRAAVGIRLITIAPGADAHPERVGYCRALGRLVVSGLTDCLLFLGSLSMFWNPQHRTWADRTAGTAVIRDRSRRHGPGRVLILAVVIAVTMTAVAAVTGVRERNAVDHTRVAAPSTTNSGAAGRSGPGTAPSTSGRTGSGKSSVGRQIGIVQVEQTGTPPQQVAETLDNYFSAINAQDYATAWRSLTPAEQAQSGGFSSFGRVMSTTTNSAVELRRTVVDSEGTVDADVTFTSHQDGEFGPQPGETCTHWAITYRLTSDNSHGYLIDGIQSSVDTAC